MPNRFKFNSTGTENNSIFTGDWAIDVRNYGGGPSSTTGFYNGTSIPTGSFQPLRFQIISMHKKTDLKSNA